MRVSVLGALEVRDGGTVVDAGPPLQRALLVLLVARADHVVPVDTIVDLLWHGEPPARATASLHAYVSGLRRLLEPTRAARAPSTVLLTRAPGYLLNTARLDVDARRFETLIRQADAAPAREALDLWDEALGLWRGEAYADVRDAEWIAADARRLAELRLTAAERRAEALIALGRPGEAAAELEGIVAEQPLRERAAALLARALYVAGRPSDALAAIRRVRTQLGEELGLDPGPELQKLEGAILRHELEPPAPAQRPIRVPATTVPVVDEEPFVGRADAIARLRAAWQAVETSGRPRVVLVDGEPGIGKTRLVSEFVRGAAVPVGWGRCPDNETAPPLWPWEQALRELNVLPADSLTAPLAAAEPDYDAAGARLRLFEDVARSLRTAAPLVLVLDDLHWADTASLRLLTHLATSSSSGAVLLLATFRRHEAAGLTATLAALARAGAVRISLDGFDVADIRTLTARVLGADPGDDAAVLLRARTGGNPFFVKQLARLPDGAALPDQVRDVVLARVERLPEPVSRLLALASVAGAAVDATVVAEVGDVDEDETLDLFDAAVAAGLLVEDEDGVTTYRFSHALVRDAVLSLLPRSRRARLHRRFGEVTGRRWADDEARAGEIARHWLAASGLDAATAREAMRATRRAAEIAARRYAPEDAAGLWQEAIAAAELAGADAGERFELLLGLAAAHEARGDTRDMVTAIDQALDHAAGAVPLVARAADAALGRSSWYPFDYGVIPHRLLAEMRGALRSPSNGSVRDRIVLLAALGATLAHCGEFEEAREVAQEAVDLARTVGDPELLARVMQRRCLALHGVDHAELQLQAATELRDLPAAPPDLSAVGALARVTALALLGRLDEAGEQLDDVLAAAESLRSPSLWVQAAVSRVAFLVFAGRYDEAAALSDQVHAVAQRLNAYGEESSRLTYLICVGYERGGLSAYVDAMIAMRDAAHFLGYNPMIALALARTGQVAEAKAQLRAAAAPPKDYTWLAWAVTRLIAAVELDLPDIVAETRQLLAPYRASFCALGSCTAITGCVQQLLGEAALYAGELELASRELTEAVVRLEAVGAGYWATRARQALAKCSARPALEGEAIH